MQTLFDIKGIITESMENYENEKITEGLINDAIKNGCKILIELLEPIEFVGDNYYRYMVRLETAEYKWIDQYRDLGECLDLTL